jgi:hypothetical protein
LGGRFPSGVAAVGRTGVAGADALVFGAGVSCFCCSPEQANSAAISSQAELRVFTNPLSKLERLNGNVTVRTT